MPNKKLLPFGSPESLGWTWDGYDLATVRSYIEQWKPKLENLHPGNSPRDVVFLRLLAQWVEIDRDYLELLDRVIPRFQQQMSRTAPIEQWLDLKFATALHDFYHGRWDVTMSTLQLIRGWASKEVKAPDCLTIVLHMMARTAWKMGAREDALGYASKAEEEARPGTRSWALVLLVKAYLEFLCGFLERARTSLDRAEEVLATTDDVRSLCNLKSARGRIERGLGHYDQALKHFDQARREFEAAGLGDDPDKGRVLTNIAVACSVQLLQDKYENKLSSRTKDTLRRHVQMNLALAERIYKQSRWNYPQRVARAHFIRAMGQLSRGEKKDAWRTARLMVDECGSSDPLIVARTCVIKACCRRGKAGWPDADRALAKATESGNRRLIIRARLVCAEKLLEGGIASRWEAYRHLEEASLLFSPVECDYMWKELNELKRRAMDLGKIAVSLKDVQAEGLRVYLKRIAVMICEPVLIMNNMDRKKTAKGLGVSEATLRRLLGFKDPEKEAERRAGDS